MKVQFLPRRKPRMTLFFIILMAFLYYSPIQSEIIKEDATTFSQEITLMEAINHISEQYQVLFNYDRKIVSDITVQYEPKEFSTVDEAISSILQETDLKYQIFNQRYVVLYKNDQEGIESLKEMIEHFQTIVDKRDAVVLERKKIPSAPKLTLSNLQSFLSSKAISFNIQGTVVDQDGEPLIGVNIQVKGSSKGTSTDFDGKFDLEDIDESAILIISYIGYQTQEVVVAGKSNIIITLLSDSQLLDEVVVVGYGKQKKVNLTGSVGVIGADQLEDRPIASVEEAIQGQIPGLKVVRTSGQPGNQNIGINIRGTSTFTDNPALIIVDGVPSSLDMLNPNDIESISVLKDAASTAIYGTRATGGVILVTTKSGQSGVPRLNFSSTVSLQSPTRWAEKASGLEFAQMHIAASNNDGVSPIFNESDLDRFSSPDWKDYDWEEYLLSNALQTNQNISVSGGSDFHKYYLSVGYLYQDGVISNTDYNRINIQLNQNFKIGNRLDLNVKGGYSPSIRTEPAYSWSELRWIHGTPKIYPFRSDNGHWLETPAHTSGGNSMANLSEDGGQGVIKSHRLSGNFSATYHLIENLDISGTYGIVNNNSRESSYKGILQVYDPENPDIVTIESSDNYLDVANFQNSLQTINLIAEYKNTFGLHNISLLGGITREWYESSNDMIGTRDFLTDNIFVVDAGSSDPNLWTIGGTAADWALQSVISRLNYSFNDRYLVEAAMRYDGSSRFSEENRWGFFPSVSAGWIISEENFLKNNNVLTFLKLRGSWGQVGNQNVGFYPFVSRLSQGAYFFNGTPQRAVSTAGAANPLLTWETKEATNFGVEGSLFENLFEFEFDFFNEKTNNILLQLPLPSTFGQAEPVQNAGRVDNRGWEIQLRHRNTIGDFNYGVFFQLSNATNEVIDMGGISPRISGDIITEEGYSMNDWYGWEADGFFQSEEEVTNHATQDPQTSAGDIRYVDQNNDGVINSNDRIRLGRSEPRFPYGVRAYFNYKNFDISVFGQGLMRHDVISRPWEASGAVDTYRKYHLDYWTPDNPNARFPKPRLGSGPLVGVNKEFSNFWLENAAYFRLKNIELGYNLPRVLVDKLGFRNARFYVAGENLMTLTQYLGYDPELATGLDRRQIQSRYPISKLFNVGIDINF